MGFAIGRKNFLLLAVVVLITACTMSLVAAAPAFASNVPYNHNVKVSAYAVDPSYDDHAQTIKVTMDFKTEPGVSAADAQEYLQGHTTIAGRQINSDSYHRNVYDLVVNGTQIIFKIGPLASGGTANFSGELKITADQDKIPEIFDAMGGADVETLIASQIAVAKDATASSSASAVFDVTARAQARSMNHILVTDVIGDKETAIFQGTGTFANGGITIHSHTFMSQTLADYANAIVSAGNAVKGSSYSFAAGVDGRFTIAHQGADCSNIQVYVYDCDYLNAHELSVGEIYEPEWDPNA